MAQGGLTVRRYSDNLLIALLRAHRPEKFVPGGGAPAIPQESQPDQPPTPDEPTPDEPTPDEPTPDEPTPDEPGPEKPVL